VDEQNGAFGTDEPGGIPLNGCEMCANARENPLIKLATAEERKINDVRIASLVTAMGKVVF